MNVAQPGPAIVRFGVFELDTASGVLRKAGVRLNLQMQPLQLLTALLEHPGAVVTREDLQQRLWAGDTFVDFERSLNAAVKRLRDTLGDSADTPRFIETMPRRGYRFIAPVEIAAPPPAMIAAPPTARPMAPATAWLLLTVIVGGSLAIAQAGGTSVLPSQLPKPPEVLAERARQILTDTARLAAPVADHAFWYWSTEPDPRVRFSYRDGSTLLIPANLFRLVSANDPAPDPARMRMVTLEADGTLSTANPTPRKVWATPSGAGPGELLYWVLMLIGFVASWVLARRNLRGGEGDRRGAWRLSVTIAFGALVFAALRAHHVPSAVDEFAWLLGASGWAGFWGAFSWLAYVGAEPYCRRWWPSALMPLARVLEGRFLDPLVGRDVLVGACVGVAWTALRTTLYSQVAPHRAPLIAVHASLEALRSSEAFASVILAAVLHSVVASLCGLALLVSFRLVLRRTWLASIALSVLVIPAYAGGTSGLDIGLAAVLVTASLVVLFKFGVVAQMALLLINFLTWLPLTLDPSAWYFGQSLALLLLVAGLAIYGFLGALGGRPAFGVMEPT